MAVPPPSSAILLERNVEWSEMWNVYLGYTLVSSNRRKLVLCVDRKLINSLLCCLLTTE